MKNISVIGAGRIGHFFAQVFNASLVTRNTGTIANEGPIIVCVRNAHLEAVVKAIPKPRREDLVFIQNGMIDPLLDKQGIGHSTRGILYFAIESKGATPVDGGGTVFTGIHALRMVAGLKPAGIHASQVSQLDFQREMSIKLLWNSIFGLLGEVYQSDVGQLLRHHASEIVILTNELSEILASELHIDLPPNLIDILTTYAEKVSFYKTRASEWEYRNGWFLSVKQTSLHQALSRQIGK
jgi:ketopantoate reductase